MDGGRDRERKKRRTLAPAQAVSIAWRGCSQSIFTNTSTQAYTRTQIFYIYIYFYITLHLHLSTLHLHLLFYLHLYLPSQSTAIHTLYPVTHVSKFTSTLEITAQNLDTHALYCHFTAQQITAQHSTTSKKQIQSRSRRKRGCVRYRECVYTCISISISIS